MGYMIRVEELKMSNTTVRDKRACRLRKSRFGAWFVAAVATKIQHGYTNITWRVSWRIYWSAFYEVQNIYKEESVNRKIGFISSPVSKNRYWMCCQQKIVFMTSEGNFPLSKYQPIQRLHSCSFSSQHYFIIKVGTVIFFSILLKLNLIFL